MKKLLAALTLALLLSLALVGAVGVGVASATHSNGEGPNNDFVRGTMKISGTAPENPSVTFEETFHVNATSGPGGGGTARTLLHHIQRVRPHQLS